MKSQLFVKPSGWLATITLISAALVTGAVTAYSILNYQSNRQPLSPPATSLKKAPSVAALGYLEPQGEVIKISAPAFTEGAKIDKLLVKRGDRLQAGQVIAILDSQPRLQAALAEAQANVIIAQSRLAQVKAGAKKGDITAQSAKFQETQAELGGQIATQRATIATLEAQLQGDQASLEATSQRIQAEVRNAQTDCRRYRMLHTQGAVSEQERDRYCLQAETTQKSLNEAQANRSRTISTLTQRIKEAKANLDRTVKTINNQVTENRARLDAVAEVRPVDVQVAQAELMSAQAAVLKAKANLDLAYVKAPESGQILKIHTWPGELISNNGIADFGQTEQMFVSAEVYETDISRIQLGQKARINIDGMIGDMTGVVDEIGLQIARKDVLGTDPVADADARVVEVKICLDAASSQKVAGLTNLQVNVVIEAK
jgi:HlyD family secretion protein